MRYYEKTLIKMRIRLDKNKNSMIKLRSTVGAVDFLVIKKALKIKSKNWLTKMLIYDNLIWLSQRAAGRFEKNLEK